MAEATQVTEPLKPTGQTSYSRIFLALILFGPPYVFAMILLARRFLSPEDVEWIRSSLSAVLGIGVTGSGAATVYGGLAKTMAKIATQKALATQSQPVREIGGEVLDGLFNRFQKRGESDNEVEDYHGEVPAQGEGFIYGGH